MKRIIFTSGLFALALFCRAWADEVTLNDGKVLSGTIVQEDKNEIGIMLGEKMFLRVDRSDIQSIKRTAEALPPEPVHQRDPFEPRSNASPAAIKKPPLAQPSSDVVFSKKIAVEFIVISESIVEKKISFSGKKLSEAEDEILSALNEIAPEEVRLKALHSKVDCLWDGKSAPSGSGYGWREMEIVSTMTFSQADWNPGISPKRDETETWDLIAAQLKSHDEKVLKTYEDALQDAAQVMVNLQCPSSNDLKNETEQLIKERISRADKKKRAVDRLTENALLKIINN